MKNKVIVLYILLFSVSVILVHGQVNDHSIRQKILKKEVINKEYVFGKWTEKGGTETHLIYLGKVTTEDGEVFKVMNSIWIWGLSGKATSRLLIFNNYNKYVGEYYLSTVSDLPNELKQGFLIFKNTDGDCDEKIITKIDLKKGLPKQFFRKCTERYGDIYTFGSNN